MHTSHSIVIVIVMIIISAAEGHLHNLHSWGVGCGRNRGIARSAQHGSQARGVDRRGQGISVSGNGHMADDRACYVGHLCLLDCGRSGRWRRLLNPDGRLWESFELRPRARPQR